VFQQYPDAGVIPDVHLAYAGLLLRQENFIEAIDHYRIILETAPDNDDVMYYALQNIAQAYEEIGFFEAALEYTETFIERFPGDPAVINKHVRIGSLYQRAGLHERAIEKFQSLMLYADRPLETELRYYAGDSFHSMGSFRRAIREFQTVTEIDPRTSQLDWTATALYMAGQSYEQLGDATEAIAMYQSIINHRNIEAQYKAAARREIERVRGAMRQTN
jgi:tetratricopeptide (TPR) repeat protein